MGVDFEVLGLLMLASEVINMMQVVFGSHEVKASKNFAAVDCDGVKVNFKHFFDIDEALEAVEIWFSERKHKSFDSNMKIYTLLPRT